MSDVITVSTRRSFWSSFAVVMHLWFGAPPGYIAAASLAACMAYFSYDGHFPWLAGLAGMAWVALMIPLFMAMQAWKIARWYRAWGQPVLCFDAAGATSKNGDIVTRIPWSSVKRVKLTRGIFFVYIAPRLAWYFARSEASRQAGRTSWPSWLSRVAQTWNWLAGMRRNARLRAKADLERVLPSQASAGLKRL